MSILIPDGTALVSPQSLAEFTSGSKTGTKHQAIVVCDSAGNVVDTLASAPAGTERALITRNIPSGTQNVADGGGSLTVDRAEVSTSGSITAISQSVQLTTTGAISQVAISVTGTFTGTINVQGTVDGGTTWTTVRGVQTNSGGVIQQWTGAADGIVALSGYTAIRMFSTAWTSGTANIVMRGSYEPGVVQIANSPVLGSGANTVGSIGNNVTSNPAGVRLSDGTAALIGQKAMTASLPVTLASDQSALSVASHAVTDGGGSLTVDSTQLPAALGQGTMAQSLPVTMAANQGAISIQGTTLAQVSGTIVNATSVVGGATDYSNVNNVTVTISGTYAGVNAAFEVSDNAGTTWFPIAGQRDDNAVAESTSGVLPANQSRSWVFSLLGYDRMRVRATAWTSGTANVRMSTASMPFEPVVSSVTNKPPSAISTAFQFSGAAVTAEALASLTPYRAGVAGSAGTSQAITAGKSFRLQAMTVGYRVGAAAVGGGIAYLRWLAGTVLVASPILASVGASANAAVSGSGGGTTLTFGDGFDIPPGFSLGVTHIGHATTATITISVLGYEY